MKNRAKCKLCLSVIESFHSGDRVFCKCGEIEVSGGDAMYCGSRNWNNFLRIDDEGNEIIVKVKDISEQDLEDKVGGESTDHPKAKPTHEELMYMIDEIINNIEKLPESAKSTFVNHYDLCAVYMLMKMIFSDKERFKSST